MVVNFRAREISRGARKLTWIPTLNYIYIYIYALERIKIKKTINMPQPTSENVYTRESLCETIEEDN